MKKKNSETLRLMFVVRPNEIDAVRSLSKQWGSAFDAWPNTLKPEICVWVTGQDLPDVSIPGLCFHRLELPEELDFYARSPRERTLWSPWGLKSGPNFQFFEILRRMHTSHHTEWVLQLETDTVPVRSVEQADIAWILENEELWVAGSSADYAESTSLSASTAQHINGAAFYRVGSHEFVDFLALTWARSLLQIASVRPALAYDSLTSPGVWRELSDELHFSWQDNEKRFSFVSGMVNLSNKKLNSAGAKEQLREVGYKSGNQASPWFLHLAKSNPTGEHRFV